MKEFKEFENVKICGLIENWGVVRSFEYALRKERTRTIMYFLSYCFLDFPTGTFNEMKRKYLEKIDLRRIIRSEYISKIKRKLLKGILKGSVQSIDPKELQRLAINSIQGLALYKLRGESGSSLLDDVFKLWRRGILSRDDAFKVMESLLEMYKARLVNKKERYKVVDPKRFEGIKIALEVLESSL